MSRPFESSNTYSSYIKQGDINYYATGDAGKFEVPESFIGKNDDIIFSHANYAGKGASSSDKGIYGNTDIDKVAKWFLYHESMTNKKLQKMCYYAYCWFIVWFNDLEDASPEHPEKINSICDDSFEAWIHGPVCRSLYYKYRIYGWNSIPKEENRVRFVGEVERLLEQVWEAYGELNAEQLETLSHREDPWQKARKGLEPYEPGTAIISKYDILEYYSKVNG